MTTTTRAYTWLDGGVTYTAQALIWSDYVTLVQRGGGEEFAYTGTRAPELDFHPSIREFMLDDGFAMTSDLAGRGQHDIVVWIEGRAYIVEVRDYVAGGVSEWGESIPFMIADDGNTLSARSHDDGVTVTLAMEWRDNDTELTVSAPLESVRAFSRALTDYLAGFDTDDDAQPYVSESGFPAN